MSIFRRQVFLKEQVAAYFEGQVELDGPQNSKLCLDSAFSKAMLASNKVEGWQSKRLLDKPGNKMGILTHEMDSSGMLTS